MLLIDPSEIVFQQPVSLEPIREVWIHSEPWMRIMARRMNDECSHCHLASRVRVVGKNAFDGTGTVVAPGAAAITVLNVGG
jgi:hypothetical protein